MRIQIGDTTAWVDSNTLPGLTKAILQRFARERGIPTYQSKKRLAEAIIRHETKKAGYEALQRS